MHWVVFQVVSCGFLCIALGCIEFYTKLSNEAFCALHWDALSCIPSCLMRLLVHYIRLYWFELGCIELYSKLAHETFCALHWYALSCIPSCLMRLCIRLYWFALGCIELYSKLSNEGSLLRP